MRDSECTIFTERFPDRCDAEDVKWAARILGHGRLLCDAKVLFDTDACCFLILSLVFIIGFSFQYHVLFLRASSSSSGVHSYGFLMKEEGNDSG